MPITAKKNRVGELGNDVVGTKSIEVSNLVVLQLVGVSGTTADVDYELPFSIKVMDAWLVKLNAAGGGAGNWQIKNGATAITGILDINIADKTISRATTIDDAQDVVISSTIRLTRTRTASTDESALINILCVRQ